MHTHTYLHEPTPPHIPTYPHTFSTALKTHTDPDICFDVCPSCPPRPSFLVLPAPSASVARQVELCRFVELFCRPARGLMSWGRVVLGNFGDPEPHKERAAMLDSLTLRQHRVHGFVDAVVSSTPRLGFQLLMQTNGLGRLRPNTVVRRFEAGWERWPPQDAADYVDTLRDAFALGLGAVLVRNLPDDFTCNWC